MVVKENLDRKKKQKKSMLVWLYGRILWFLIQGCLTVGINLLSALKNFVPVSGKPFYRVPSCLCFRALAHFHLTNTRYENFFKKIITAPVSRRFCRKENCTKTFLVDFRSSRHEVIFKITVLNIWENSLEKIPGRVFLVAKTKGIYYHRCSRGNFLEFFRTNIL